MQLCRNASRPRSAACRQGHSRARRHPTRSQDQEQLGLCGQRSSRSRTSPWVPCASANGCALLTGARCRTTLRSSCRRPSPERPRPKPIQETTEGAAKPYLASPGRALVVMLCKRLTIARGRRSGRRGHVQAKRAARGSTLQD